MGMDPAAALERVDRLHTALTQLVLGGGDLDLITAEVGRVLDLGVIVTATDGRPRAGSFSAQAKADLIAAHLVDETGRYRVERASGDGAPVASGRLLSLPVAAGGSDLARLLIHRTEGGIPEEDVHALERAAAVTALLIMREQAVTAVENKYQGDFLRDILLRRAGDRQYVVEHAQDFGWDLDRPAVVIAAEIDPPSALEPAGTHEQQRSWQTRFAAGWRQVSRSLDPAAPSVDFTSEVVTILPAVPHEEAARVLVAKAVAGVAGDGGGGRRPFSVGVSRVAQSLTDLPDCYGQARRALEIGRRIHGGRSTTYFDQLGVHRLIALVPHTPELTAFVTDVLGPLADHTSEAKDLRVTLQVLLDTNFNVAEAARAQFFHYNTMRYRVGKLERLLGPLTRDPHLRLDVAVALRVLEVIAP